LADKSEILKGYKKVGQHFIPPLKQLTGNREASYVNDMLPELIWIGLINDNIGYIQGARLLEEIVKLIDELKEEDQHGNFAYISMFNSLSDDQKSELIKRLDNLKCLDEIRNYLAPLILLYDKCPLKFFGPPSITYKEDELIESIKSCVGAHIDKWDTPGIVLNGAVMLTRLVTNKLYFSKSIKLPDLNSVINEPESDEAKHAAAFMRASALGEFGMMEIDPAWAKYFWNRGMELNPCDFYEHTEDE